jgi:hypothetical protein
VIAVVVVAVAAALIPLAATGRHPRWRDWCVPALGASSVIAGGTFAAVEGGTFDGVLMVSVFCAVLGVLAGNIIRILSGPSRPEVHEEARR